MSRATTATTKPPAPRVDVDPQQKQLIDLERQSLEISGVATVQIVDQPSYDDAVSFRSRVKTFLDWGLSVFEPMREKTYAAYNSVLTQKKRVLEPAERQLRVIDNELSRWTREQRRIEEDRRRQEEENERHRLEGERSLRALEADDAGADKETVEAISQEPIVMPMVRPEPTFQKAAEISTVDNWKASIVDLKKLVKYVAKECDKNRGLLELIVGLKVTTPGTYESPGLNKMAKAQKQSLTIPGVNVYNDSYVKSASPRR